MFSPSRSAAAPELAYLKSFRHKQKHVAQASYDVETTSSGPSRTRPGGALTQAPRRRDKACLEACRLVSGEARSSLCESDWLRVGLSAVAARRRAAHFVGSQQRWNVQVSKERREGKRKVLLLLQLVFPDVASRLIMAQNHNLVCPFVSPPRVHRRDFPRQDQPQSNLLATRALDAGWRLNNYYITLPNIHS